MQNIRFLVASFPMCRFISLSSMNSNLSRESKFMKKIMHRSKKLKNVWYDTSADLRSATKYIEPLNKPLSTNTVRRMTIRNKLFMEYITDLFSMGEFDLINKQIEITHVKITPDFKYVNVFWIHTNNSLTIDEEMLQKYAKIIRHELSQLRVIGVVPPIQFVKNKQFLIQNEVDKRLSEADYGKDYKSLPYSEEIQLAMSHSNITDQSLSKESPIIDHNSETNKISVPIMRQDVLGLDHYKIMSQITASLSKSRIAAKKHMLDINNNTDNNSTDNPNDLVSNKNADFITQEEHRQIFSDFLHKKRMQEKYKYRMKKLCKHEIINFEEEIDIDYERENDNGEYNDEYSNEDNDEYEKMRHDD